MFPHALIAATQITDLAAAALARLTTDRGIDLLRDLSAEAARNTAGYGVGVVLGRLLIERIDFGRLRSSLAAEIPWPPCRDRQSSGRRGTLRAPSRANVRPTPSAPPPRKPRRATRVNLAIPDQSCCESLRGLLTALAIAAATDRIRLVPSCSPFSKSSPPVAMVLVTCATHTTSRWRAAA
jgi:hypothetical protein